MFGTYAPVEREWSTVVKVSVELNYEDIEAVMVGALEGGSDYWVDDIEFELTREKGVPPSIWATRELLQNRVVRLHDGEEDKWYDLTLGKLVEGIQKFVYHRLQQGSLYLENRDGPRIDWGQHDADDTDGCLQFALFGDWIYG